MAITKIVGFETGDFSQIAAASGTGSIQSTIKRTGSYALKINPSTSSTSYSQLDIGSQFAARFYFYAASIPAAAELCFEVNTDTVNILVLLHASGDNRLEARRGGVSKGFSAAISAGTWYRIDVKASSGAWAISLDGTEFATDNQVASAFGLRLGKTADTNSQSVEFYYDDVLANNLASAYPLGAGQSIARQPGPGLGTPTYNAWTKSTGTDAGAVWDNTPFTTGDYCSVATSAAAQTSFVSPFSAGTNAIGASDTINACQVALIAKTSATSSNGTNLNIRRRVNSADTGVLLVLTTSDAYYQETTLWTATRAQLDAMEAGAYTTLATRVRTVEDVWVFVDYTPPAGPTSHATSGALVGAGKVIAGTAARTRTHTSTGVLVGAGKVIVGSAARGTGAVSHATSGALAGPGATLAGTAARSSAAFVGRVTWIELQIPSAAGTHTTSGTLTGPGTVIAGTAARTRAHATTGALVGVGKVIAGTASSKTTRTSTGALVGSGKVVSGTAARMRAHATSGVLVGAGKVIVGAAARSVGAVSHATSGALVGAGKVIVGSAARSGVTAAVTVVLDGYGLPVFQIGASAAGLTVYGLPAYGASTSYGIPIFPALGVVAGVHATTGALVGAGTVVAGTAAHKALHATSGALVGVGKVVSGTAARMRAHAATGALVGPGAVLAGTAQHRPKHTTTGVLVGAGSTLSGTAARTRVHSTSGVLVGTGKVISGVAARIRIHTSTGTLVGPGAVLAGLASRSTPGAAHATSGALAASATLAGVAHHKAIHVISGALIGTGKVISGSAARTRNHATSGVLAGAGATLAGVARHQAKHVTSGVLAGVGKVVSGSAARMRAHATSGTLVGAGKVIAGVAARTRAHATSGVLAGAGSTLSGSAARAAPTGPHTTIGALVGPGAVVSGSAALFAIAAPPTGFAPGPAGKRRKRRKSVVEIDGEQFTVWDEGEAVALLEHARELAEQRAASAAKSALNKARKLRRQTGTMPVLEVAVPELKFVSGDTDIRALVAQFQEAIDRLYLTTAREVEIAYYLRRKHQDEDDEEDAITMLLLH